MFFRQLQSNFKNNRLHFFNFYVHLNNWEKPCSITHHYWDPHVPSYWQRYRNVGPYSAYLFVWFSKLFCSLLHLKSVLRTRGDVTRAAAGQDKQTDRQTDGCFCCHIAPRLRAIMRTLNNILMNKSLYVSSFGYLTLSTSWSGIVLVIRTLKNIIRLYSKVKTNSTCVTVH